MIDINKKRDENAYIPVDLGDIRCKPTLLAPALCPNMVTESGSPPKARMFSCTNTRLCRWSSKPRFGVTASSAVVIKPNVKLKWRSHDNIIMLHDMCIRITQGVFLRGVAHLVTRPHNSTCTHRHTHSPRTNAQRHTMACTIHLQC